VGDSKVRRGSSYDRKEKNLPAKYLVVIIIHVNASYYKTYNRSHQSYRVRLNSKYTYIHTYIYINNICRYSYKIYN